MPNSVYDATRYKLMTAGFSWMATQLMLVAWSGPAGFYPEDETIDDLVAHGSVKRGQSLPITTQSVSPDGTAQTGQVVIPALAIGTPITFFTMVDKKPNVGMSELILFIDDAIELPFIPNGLDMVVQPDWLSKRGWWRA